MTNLPVCQGAKPSVPWVMTPTRVGTRMPGMVASMLVMAIRVPEMGVSAFLTFDEYLGTCKVRCQIRLVREHPGEHAENSGWPQQRNRDLFYKSLLIDRCVTAFTSGAIRWLKNMVSPSIQHYSKDSERHHYQNVLASEDDCNLWIYPTIWIYATMYLWIYATMYRVGWE